MTRSTKFWVSMAIFQVAFGFTVFALTREHYVQAVANNRPAAVPRPAMTAQPRGMPQSDLARFATATAIQPTSNDPVLISRQADEFFSNQQYSNAAELYERLLSFDPNNVEVYNNLGITLHYIGRSDEALRRLDQGVAIDPTHQRIWLTLGYVNSQLGNAEQARTALTKAVQMDPDNDIGQSAAKMLEALP